MTEESYEYIKAIVDCGELRWEYCLKGSHQVSRMSHDEDVSDYSDEEIIRLVRTCRSHQAPMTFNVGIYQDGTMAPASVER